MTQTEVLDSSHAHLTLKAWRQAHRLSQRAAARHLGLSQADYQRYETGTNCPRPQRAAKLMLATGVSLATLYGIAG